MAEPDQVCRAAGVVQEAVIEPLSITDPVSGQIKADSGNDNQTSFVSLMINTCRAWLQNSKRPLLQFLNGLNLAKDHLVAAYGRIQHPLARLKGSGKYQPCIGLIMGWCIQRNAFGSDILIKREQVELSGMA